MSNDVNVISRTQRIIVDPASSSVAVINQGPMGPAGPPGSGAVPPGGTDEQVLTKNSSTNGDVSWKTITPIVVKATEPVAADYGLATIPVGAIWVVMP